MKDYQPLLANRNVRAFLSLIRHTEGANYNTLFGGGTFDDFTRHPNKAITRKSGAHELTSTAAGAYQFLHRTWAECQAALNLPDFGELSQDQAALFLIDRRRALADVLDGDWPAAIEACNHEWASLPGSPYGQPTKSMQKCMAFLAEHSAPQEFAFRPETPMTLIEQPKPEVPNSIYALLAFFRAFQAGKEVANPVAWKDAQLVTTRLGMFGVALIGIARMYGYDYGITDAQILSFAGLVAGGFFLFCDVATVVSSSKVGLRGVPKSSGSNGSQAGNIQDGTDTRQPASYGAGTVG